MSKALPEAVEETETPRAAGILDEVAEDAVVRNALELLTSVNDHPHDDARQAEVRTKVLELFARADLSVAPPSIIAGIGRLYDHGYDVAADHMEMAHWGLPHQLS